MLIRTSVTLIENGQTSNLCTKSPPTGQVAWLDTGALATLFKVRKDETQRRSWAKTMLRPTEKLKGKL